MPSSLYIYRTLSLESPSLFSASKTDTNYLTQFSHVWELLSDILTQSITLSSCSYSTIHICLL